MVYIIDSIGRAGNSHNDTSNSKPLLSYLPYPLASVLSTNHQSRQPRPVGIGKRGGGRKRHFSIPRRLGFQREGSRGIWHVRHIHTYSRIFPPLQIASILESWIESIHQLVIVDSCAKV